MNEKQFKSHIKLKSIILIIIILIAFAMICVIGVANNVGNIQNIFGIKIQQEDEEILPFLSYQIYDNKDESKLKILAIINSESGVEYVKKSDGTIINCDGKNRIGLDYICSVYTEEPIIVKEIGKDERTEKLIITEAGNIEKPLIITTAKQLQDIQKDTDKLFKSDVPRSEIYYKLGANIDLSGIEWTPIGTREKPFEGIFDGNSENYTISNLTYSNEEKNDVGLFGYVKGTLENIKLDNFEITGKDNVGVLVGYSDGTTADIQITNSRVTGSTNTGMLIGYNNGIIKNVNTVQGEVTATGNNTGGVIGNTTKEISNSIANVTVNGTTNVGGIVGYAGGTVSNNAATGNITATANNCGGIAGYIVNNTASGNSSNVTLSGVENVGGCIGLAESTVWGTSTITNNKLNGNISGKNNLGGVIGHLYGNTATHNYVLKNYSTIDIDATGNNIGGIIGYDLVFSDGYSGYGGVTVSECYSTGKIESEGENVGGIIGNTYNYAVGYGDGGGVSVNMNDCFFIGEVVGKQNCGGLIGLATLISNSVHYAPFTVKNNYVSAPISATEENKEPFFGSFIWSSRGGYTLADNYYVPEKTGLTSSEYGVSKNLANMYSQSEFPNWNFENIWTIEEGLTMPYLRNLDKPDGVNK